MKLITTVAGMFMKVNFDLSNHLKKTMHVKVLFCCLFKGPGVWPKIENGPDSVDDGCAKGRPCFMCRCSMR